jgi:hypothetical protein
MGEKMRLPMGVLLGSVSFGCALNLDFDRFHFSGADAAIGGDSSPSPGAGGDHATAPDRCAAGARDCLDGGPVRVEPVAAGVDVGSGDRDATDGSDDAGNPVERTDGAVSRTCDQCTLDENCVLGGCQQAPASCAELKALDPTLTDGIYSIAPAGVARRTYCDMIAGVALCSDEQSDHEGVTRDPSHLPFLLTSVLVGSACRVWNVRHRDDLLPLDAFADNPDGSGLRPCTPLGFTSDPPGYSRDTPGCSYGANEGLGTCGFNPAQFRKWSNLCSCELPDDINPGHFDRYVLQGTIYVSTIPWDAVGNFSVSCGT